MWATSTGSLLDSMVPCQADLAINAMNELRMTAPLHRSAAGHWEEVDARKASLKADRPTMTHAVSADVIENQTPTGSTDNARRSREPSSRILR